MSEHLRSSENLSTIYKKIPTNKDFVALNFLLHTFWWFLKSILNIGNRFDFLIRYYNTLNINYKDFVTLNFSLHTFWLVFKCIASTFNCFCVFNTFKYLN